MSNVETLFPLETVSETVLLIESQTPAAPSTDQTTATATTVTMPKAIDSRNDVFMTDHGSRCTNRRRGRRVPRGRAVVEPVRLAAAVPVEVPVDVPVDVPRPEPADLFTAPAPAPGLDDGDGDAADCTALPAAAPAADTRPTKGRFPVSPSDSA